VERRGTARAAAGGQGAPSTWHVKMLKTVTEW